MICLLIQICEGKDKKVTLFSFQTVILDGKTGHTLWSLQTAHYEMSSDIVVKTRDLHRDAFIFRVQGRASSSQDAQKLPGLHPQRGVSKVHF